MYFEKVKDDGRWVTDWKKPVVPAHWNFEDMTYQLQLQAEMLRKLPEDRKRINTSFDPPKSDEENQRSNRSSYAEAVLSFGMATVRLAITLIGLGLA